MTSRRALLAVVLAGAALRLIHWATILPTSYPRLPETYEASDMAAFVEWAGRIQAGDLLGRDTYHPRLAWSDELGTQADWARWWGGWEVFHQAPLYAYLLALLSLLGLPFTLLAQLALGALAPLVVYRLGWRLGGTRAGLIAGALTAVYVPFVVHQAVLLRDWLPPLIDSLAVLLLLEARAQGRDGLYAAGGLALAASFLTKPTAALLLPVVALWLWLEADGRPRRAVRAGAWVLLGGVLGLTPLVTRNLAVGAPPLAVSTRFPEGFIQGNAADGYPLGLEHPPSQRALLDRGGGRPLAVVRATLATWNGDWGGLAAHEWLKLRGVLGVDEIPNNVDVAYARQRSPVLWLGVGFGGVLAPALLGVAWCLRRGWRRFALPLGWLVTALAGQGVAIAVGRYRLALAQAVIVFAGVGLAWLTRRLRAGQGRGLLVGLVVGYAAHVLLVSPRAQIRANPFLVVAPGETIAAIKLHLRDGDLDAARAELARFRARTAALDPEPAAAIAPLDARLAREIERAGG